MKAKYFKLKLASIFSFVFIVVGALGSFYLVSSMEEKINEIVTMKSKIQRIELLKTDKEVTSLDLVKYNKYTVELEKSEDGFNHIIAETIPEYTECNAEFDKNIAGRVNISSNSLIKNKNYKPFSKIEEIVDENIVFGNKITLFSKNFENRMKDKIILKLVKPVEIRFNNKLIADKNNFDYSLLKNELTYDSYEYGRAVYLLDYGIVKSNLFETNEFTVKNFSEDVLTISNFDFKKVKFEANKMDKILVISDGVSYEHHYDELITLDAKNIKEFVEVDLKGISSNINVTGAKAVVLEGIPDHTEILVKYKNKDEEKSFVIEPSAKNCTRGDIFKKVITIEADEIYRTEKDNYILKNGLKNSESLKNSKELKQIK